MCKYYSVEDVADICGVDEKTVYSWLESGILKYGDSGINLDEIQIKTKRRLDILVDRAKKIEREARLARIELELEREYWDDLFNDKLSKRLGL